MKISDEDRQWMQANELTPDASDVIRKSIEEMVNSYIRASAERDLQKEITQRVKDITKMPPKMFKRLARTHYQSSFDKEVAEHEEFTKLYENIISNEP